MLLKFGNKFINMKIFSFLKNINIVIIVLILILIGYFVGKYQNKNIVLLKNEVKTEKPIEIIPEEKRLDNIYVFQTSKGVYDVVVNSDDIWFNEFSNIVNELGHFTITKSQYPDLFKQGVANSSYILVVLSKDKSKILISNNEPYHGGLSATYRLIFDIVTKKIETNRDFMVDL